jgi:hypothetical protein
MKPISEANIEILDQLKNVLVQFENCDYKKELKILKNISIGQHTRHIIEFYQCLFLGYEIGKIDYDSRRRDLRIESDLDYAIENIENINCKLKANLHDSVIQLETSIGFGDKAVVSTTLQRELTYLIEHTIHHLAILNISISELYPSVVVPANFGVAFSTIQFQLDQQKTA